MMKQIIVHSLFSLFFLVAPVLADPSSSSLPGPEIQSQARVKQHFHKSGQLVEGEEDLRKIIIVWNALPDATTYQVCHMCEVDNNGVRINDAVGQLTDIPEGKTCGGSPCFILPGAPIGKNTFHVRAKINSNKEEWTLWSKAGRFDTTETGMSQHEEL